MLQLRKRRSATNALETRLFRLRADGFQLVKCGSANADNRDIPLACGQGLS
jgi:hypothetical protein